MCIEEFYDGVKQGYRDIVLMLEKNDPDLLQQIIPYVDELMEETIGYEDMQGLQERSEYDFSSTLPSTPES